MVAVPEADAGPNIDAIASSCKSIVSGCEYATSLLLLRSNLDGDTRATAVTGSSVDSMTVHEFSSGVAAS